MKRGPERPTFFQELDGKEMKTGRKTEVGTFQVLESRFQLPALESFLLPAGMGIL